MGWNSWDCFGMDITEAQVKATAEYMARNMKDAGWQYIVVDMGWYYGEGLTTKNFHKMKNPPQYLDAYGRLYPSKGKFPSAADGKGLKSLADYVHSLGLKFGIHIMRGIPWQAVEQNLPIKNTVYRAKELLNPDAPCWWYDGLRGLDMNKPGAREYYQSLIELYAQWGVDYIKADDMEKPYAKQDIEALREAIVASGRPIVLSLSAGPISVGVVEHLRANANMWRISDDMWDDWFFIKRQFGLCRMWQDYAEPGHWPDCDMLPLGRLRINGVDEVGILAKAIHQRPADLVNQLSLLSQDEQRTLLSLWYIFRSPLMMGGNLLEYDQGLLQMLTNEEALAVDQRSTRNRELRADNDEIIWTAVDRETDERYLALFNINNETRRRVAVTWAELGLDGPHTVRDLWAKADAGRFDSGFEVTLAPHSSGLYRIETR
jgi:hypothetical protein